MIWLIGSSCLFVGLIIGFFVAAILASGKNADVQMEHMLLSKNKNT